MSTQRIEAEPVATHVESFPDIETGSAHSHRVMGNADPVTSAARKALSSVIRTQRDAIAREWTERHLAIAEIRDAVRQEAGGTSEAGYYHGSYLLPLLDLLAGAVLDRDPAWVAVYLDERTRFVVPNDLNLKAHDRVLEKLIAPDIDDLSERLPRKHRPAAKLFLSVLHAPLERKSPQSPVRLLLIGDCIMTELRAFLAGSCRTLGAEISIRHQYFSFNRGTGLNISDAIDHIGAGSVDMVALSFFTFEGLPLYRALLADAGRLSSAECDDRVTGLLRIVREMVASLREKSDIPILLHNACGLPLENVRRRLPFVAPIERAKRDVLRRLNDGLRELADRTENVILIDENSVVEPTGLRGAAKNLFPRALRKRALFHTSTLGPLLATTYAPIIGAYAALRRTKVLLIDFDNTLWSGVMADGDVKHDVRAQQILRKVREAGILLVAVSKNDPQLIRWSEMVLTPEDFALHKISWNQKVQSVAEAAKQLDVGTDTFAFIDDNPVERALVRDRFPEIHVFDPADQSTWSAIELMLSFPNTRQTEESASRTALYREGAQRREALVANIDYPQMMRSLQLKASWGPAQTKDLGRILELLQRTNQFNTTTKRRTLGELRELLANSAYHVFTFSLSDRFGNLGVVGVAILQSSAGMVTFDSVVMSCRAMGFGLESLLIRAPLDYLISEQSCHSSIRGLFFSTERNEPASTLFAKSGFQKADDDQWVLARDADLPEVPDWLSVVTA